MINAARKYEPSLLESFRRDGFVVVSNLFDEQAREAVAWDLVNTFARRAKSLGFELPVGIGRPVFSELLASLFRADIPAYMAAAKLTQYLASVHKLGVCVPLIDLLGDVGLSLPAISTRPVIHYMADRLKIPGGYQKTAPHQDWRSVQGSLDGVTVWSPLFDVGLNDYPLEVIVGSHLDGLLDHRPDAPNYSIDSGLRHAGDFQPLLMNAGDAVLFSGFLVHRTGERGGDAVRVSFSFRFNNVDEPTFADRNFPNTYIYRPDHAIVTPEFPSKAMLRDVFGGAGR